MEDNRNKDSVPKATRPWFEAVVERVLALMPER